MQQASTSNDNKAEFHTLIQGAVPTMINQLKHERAFMRSAAALTLGKLSACGKPHSIHCCYITNLDIKLGFVNQFKLPFLPSSIY